MKKIQGFTLLEMMVAVGVFSLLMLLVMMILRGGEEQTRLADIKMALQESARESLYRMGQEIRESSPARVAITNGGQTLTFQIPAVVSNSGTITWSNPLTYQVGGTGTQLIRTDTGTGQTTVLANDIQSVNFAMTGNPANTVTYTVNARRTLINGRLVPENSPLTQAGEARLRNP